MIVARIGPNGVEKVSIHANSESAEDAALAVWPLVRDQLKRLDKRLRNAAAKREQSRESERHLMTETIKGL